MKTQKYEASFNYIGFNAFALLKHRHIAGLFNVQVIMAAIN